jgi:hypothetical protein
LSICCHTNCSPNKTSGNTVTYHGEFNGSGTVFYLSYQNPTDVLPKFLHSPFIFTAELNHKTEQRKYFGFRVSSVNILCVPTFSCNIWIVEHTHGRETSVPGNQIGVCNLVLGNGYFVKRGNGQKLCSTYSLPPFVLYIFLYFTLSIAKNEPNLA